MQEPVLHHASIRVADVPRARAFYEQVLGFKPIARPDMGFPGAWYGLGSGQLHLIQGEAAAPAVHAINPTDPHFAVTVDLDEMRARLKDTGVATLDSGADQLWVLDPDGNTVELRQDPRS